jgi:hypothetical protein
MTKPRCLQAAYMLRISPCWRNSASSSASVVWMLMLRTKSVREGYSPRGCSAGPRAAAPVAAAAAAATDAGAAGPRVLVGARPWPCIHRSEPVLTLFCTKRRLLEYDAACGICGRYSS